MCNSVSCSGLWNCPGCPYRGPYRSEEETSEKKDKSKKDNNRRRKGGK